MKNSRTLWRDPILWLLIGMGLLLRISYNLALHPGGHDWSSFIIDEREYFGAAHMLSEGRGFSFFDTALWVRPPLYVLLLGGIIRIVGTVNLPVLLAQSLLSAATLIPLASLAHKIAGLRAALWTAALGALYLPFTLFAGLLLSETLFLFLFAWAFVALLQVRDSLENWGRSSIGWLLVSGLLLGLATLTRATTLAFIPFVALWLAWAARNQTWRRRILSIGLLLTACFLTLAPWTLRNYASYGRFVAVDTTSGYNLWLASIGVRDEARLQADLRPITNPADRQSFAYTRAWENISADPGGFIFRGLKETLDLWRPLFSAEERQVRGYALGRVPPWHLLSLLLFDDLLYAAVLLLSLFGLALSPPGPLKGLTGLWVLLWTLLAFVFFAVTRFRLPVVAALLPWAGAGVSMLAERRAMLSRLRLLPNRAKLATIASTAGVLLLVAPAIPIADSLLGIERWNRQDAYRKGETLLEAGKVQHALAQYKQADIDLSDTRYSLAAAYLQANQIPLALSTLHPDESPDRFEPPIIRGEAARLSGDLKTARSFFNARVVQTADDAALRWAWDHLDPPLVSRIDIGSGLDVGYVTGFYRPETDENNIQFRWSGEYPRIRGLKTPDTLVKWSGWRPPGPAPAHITPIWHSDSSSPIELFSMTLDSSKQWLTNNLGPSDPHSTSSDLAPLNMMVNPFVASGSDPRLLGIRISSIGADK